jgi:hypothetical protein
MLDKARKEEFKDKFRLNALLICLGSEINNLTVKD